MIARFSCCFTNGTIFNRANLLESYLSRSSYSPFEPVTYISIKSGSSSADQQCCLLPLANRGTFKTEKGAAAGEIKKNLYRFLLFKAVVPLKRFSGGQRNMFPHISPIFLCNGPDYVRLINRYTFNYPNPLIRVLKLIKNATLK